MIQHFGIQGIIPKTVGKGAAYFKMRNIHIDCRGPVTIDRTSDWGSNIDVLTVSHRPSGSDNAWNANTYRPVIVKAHARILNSCVLYNCIIGEGAILAAGTVVRSRDVPAWTIVEGNPARIIADYNHTSKKWIYRSLGKETILRRKK